MTGERKVLKISRRNFLLGTGAGVLLGANGVAILVKNAADRAQSLKLKFQGPFDYDQELSFENRKDSPVTVASIAFLEKDLGNYLLLDFSFNGNKDRGRTIDLTVMAKDSVGNMIVHDHVLCHDARIPPAKPSGGTEPNTPILANHQTVPLNRVIPEQIAQLEITFGRDKGTF